MGKIWRCSTGLETTHRWSVGVGVAPVFGKAEIPDSRELLGRRQALMFFESLDGSDVTQLFVEHHPQRSLEVVPDVTRPFGVGSCSAGERGDDIVMLQNDHGLHLRSVAKDSL